MGYIQLSLFGKTSWERFLQMTGWILEPCCNHFPIPKFQCLLLEDGLTPVWCEGEKTDLCWRLMDAQYWGKPRLVQRRKRIFLVADFRGQRSAEILFKPRDMFPIPPPCTDYGLPAAGASRISLDKTRGKIPIIRPFQERRMRSAAKSGNQSAFLASFGRPDEPFPTLLAKASQYDFILV